MKSEAKKNKGGINRHKLTLPFSNYGLCHFSSQPYALTRFTFPVANLTVANSDIRGCFLMAFFLNDALDDKSTDVFHGRLLPTFSYDAVKHTRTLLLPNCVFLASLLLL